MRGGGRSRAVMPDGRRGQGSTAPGANPRDRMLAGANQQMTPHTSQSAADNKPSGIDLKP
jgi:hypothetical protein